MNSLTLRASIPELKLLLHTKVIGVRVVDAWEYHLDFERDRTLFLCLNPDHNTVYWSRGADKQAKLTRVPRLASALKDHLTGARLTEVTQAGLDRVVSLSFEHRDRLGDPVHHQVVAELIGKGSNLILLAGNTPFEGKLVERLRFDRSQNGGRHLSYGARYTLPESNKIDVLTASREDLEGRLQRELESHPREPRKALGAAWEGVSPDAAWEIQRMAASDQPRDLAEAWIALVRETAPGASRVEALIATGPTGRLRVLPYRPSKPGADLTLEAHPTLMEALGAAHEGFKKLRQKKPNQVLAQNIARAIKRSENAQKAISKETGSPDKDPEFLRLQGDTLLSHAHTVTKGAKQADLPHPETGEVLTIKLNPKLTPAENAALLFKKSQKASRAGGATQNRSRDLSQRLKDLKELERALSQLGDRPPDGAFLERAHELGVSLPKEEAKRLKDETASMASELRPRTYDLGNGWELLVGKNNKGNHVLTFELAKPQDVWMHAAQCPGSHVVLRHPEKGKEPPRDVLLTAAGIAAYFSKARNSTKVPVTVTEKRYVRRPRKAPVGQALVGEHKTVMVVPINPEGKS